MKVTFVTRRLWDLALEMRRLTQDTHHGSYPHEDDVFEPTIAFDKNGDMIGWCQVVLIDPEDDYDDPPTELEAVLFSTSDECYAEMTQEMN